MTERKNDITDVKKNAAEDISGSEGGAGGGIPDADSLSDGELRHARMSRLCRLADRVVDRLEDAADSLDSTDTQRFKHIVSSIKEIRDIQNLRSDSELREQELKLAALERQSREEADGVDEITVVIEGDEDLCG